MICPKCRAEYRRGFEMCRDCDLPLVESPELLAGSSVNSEPTAMPGDANEDPFCSFWKGTDLRVCTEICTVLDEAGIPHKTIRRQDHLFNLNNQSPYEVGVPASRYEKAELAIKEAFGTEEESGEEGVRLLPPPEEDPRARELQSVWVGDSAIECAVLCRELKEVGIYYRVDEQKELRVGGTKDRYEIGVAEADYERANEITGGLHPEVADEDDDEDEGQETIAANDDGDSSDTVGSAKRIRDEDWYPEDATSLAWDGEPAYWRNMIEMSFKENDIRMRWEMEGVRPQLYVLPDDEERAKEIVREILEDEPMK